MDRVRALLANEITRFGRDAIEQFRADRVPVFAALAEIGVTPEPVGLDYLLGEGMIKRDGYFHRVILRLQELNILKPDAPILWRANGTTMRQRCFVEDTTSPIAIHLHILMRTLVYLRCAKAFNGLNLGLLLQSGYASGLSSDAAIFDGKIWRCIPYLDEAILIGSVLACPNRSGVKLVSNNSPIDVHAIAAGLAGPERTWPVGSGGDTENFHNRGPTFSHGVKIHDLGHGSNHIAQSEQRVDDCLLGYRCLNEALRESPRDEPNAEDGLDSLVAGVLPQPVGNIGEHFPPEDYAFYEYLLMGVAQCISKVTVLPFLDKVESRADHSMYPEWRLAIQAVRDVYS